MKKKTDKKNTSISDRLTHFYIRRIKKRMRCPACKDGEMIINNKASFWVCKDCGYKLSADEFEDDYVFWFCDECESYLNNQEGFDCHAPKHICRNCGYENDTSVNNIMGICADCGRILPDPTATLCADCRQARRDAAKRWLITAGKVAGTVAAVAGAIYLATRETDNHENIKQPDLLDGDMDGDTEEDDDEVYGLGEGIFPNCNACGAEMNIFDGWAFYTCPECGNKVRIIEGNTMWYSEIFKEGKKQHRSDFELADFCRGGDLTED